jgi:hypothetical protein
LQEKEAKSNQLPQPYVSDWIFGFQRVILDIGFLAFVPNFLFTDMILKVLLSMMLEAGCSGTICNYKHYAQDSPLTNL